MRLDLASLQDSLHAEWGVKRGPDDASARQRRREIILRHAMIWRPGAWHNCADDSSKTCYPTEAAAAECARELYDGNLAPQLQRPYPCVTRQFIDPHWHLTSKRKARFHDEQPQGS